MECDRITDHHDMSVTGGVQRTNDHHDMNGKECDRITDHHDMNRKRMPKMSVTE